MNNETRLEYWSRQTMREKSHEILCDWQKDHDFLEAQLELAASFQAKYMKKINELEEKTKLLTAIRESVRELDSHSAPEAIHSMLCKKYDAVIALEKWDLENE